MVIGRLNSYSCKEVGDTEVRPRFLLTLIRKHAMTKTQNFQPNFENDLANLMCNSWEMQKQTYCLDSKCKNVSNQSTAQDFSERVKVNWKTVTMLYNTCVQLKLLIAKSQLLWLRLNRYKSHRFMIWQIWRREIRCGQSCIKWKL